MPCLPTAQSQEPPTNKQEDSSKAFPNTLRDCACGFCKTQQGEGHMKTKSILSPIYHCTRVVVAHSGADFPRYFCVPACTVPMTTRVPLGFVGYGVCPLRLDTHQNRSRGARVVMKTQRACAQRCLREFAPGLRTASDANTVYTRLVSQRTTARSARVTYL